MSDQKAWTPDQPLRADATDEQMSERFTHLAESALPYFAGGKRYATRIAMAREYAAACVAALPVPPAGTREAVEEGRMTAGDRATLAILVYKAQDIEPQVEDKYFTSSISVGMMRRILSTLADLDRLQGVERWAREYLAHEDSPMGDVNDQTDALQRLRFALAALPVPREGEAET